MDRTAIICVDDEEIVLSSLGKQLKRNFGKNYDIELFSTPQEALFVCAELEAGGISVALVISDQKMPGMSGDEFLIRLHAAYPKIVKILLTGQADADSVGNVVNAAGLFRYIAKPWHETNLILTVKEALRCYEQEQKLAEQNIVLQRTNKLLERKNYKLSKSLKLLLVVFETVSEGIIVLDDRDEIIVFNQKFANLWQIDSNSIKGNISHISGLLSRRITETNALGSILDRSNYGTAENKILTLHNGTVLESYFQIQKLDEKTVGRVWRFRELSAEERSTL